MAMATTMAWAMATRRLTATQRTVTHDIEPDAESRKREYRRQGDQRSRPKRAQEARGQTESQRPARSFR